jgi:hypothetical protein
MHGRVGDAPVSGLIWRRLPSWQERQPPSPLSSTAASPNTQVTRKTAQAKAGAGGAATAKTRAAQGRHRQQRRDLRSRLQHTDRYLPRTRSSAAHARAVASGMFPHVGRRLLGEGAFDTRQRARVRTPSYSKAKAPWVRSSTPRGPVSASGQLNTALQVSGCARCKWAWTPQQKAAREAGRGKHTPRQQLPSRDKAPTRGLPATRAGSASLSSTPRPWTRHSASGL